MQYLHHYASPLGKLLLAADEIGLTGLWFEGQRYYGHGLEETCPERNTPILTEVIGWLDLYFSGREPDFLPPLHVTGTAFQMQVWESLLTIPYGKTMTYGQIAKQLASQMGLPQMSAQAVGNAVGRNKISILVPCHRVVGTNGSLTGYAGGLDKKIALLQLEQAEGWRIP